MKTDQAWTSATPLLASESATVRGAEVDLSDTVGTMRVVCTPVTMTAVYNVVVEMETDVSPWMPESSSDVTTGAKTGTDNKVTCYRLIHVMSNTAIAQGFLVPCFGMKKARLSVWGAAGDTVNITICKLNRSPT